MLLWNPPQDDNLSVYEVSCFFGALHNTGERQNKRLDGLELQMSPLLELLLTLCDF